MRGFKPSAARAAAQNYADGGLVKSLKGLLGFDAERNAQVAEYRRNSAAEAQQKRATQQAAAPAPAPQRAISQYASGNRLDQRLREAEGYKDGGPVRGPGTGTSDDVPDEVPEGTYIMPADSTQAIGEPALAGMGAEGVPVNLSDGEFKLPPEQVHAVGVQALDQMKDATHAPAARQEQSAGLGFKPELFFANGGVVEDERKRRNSFGDAAAAASNPQVRQIVPTTPSNIFPQSHLRPKPSASVPSSPVGASPASSPPSAPGPSRLYMQDRGEEMAGQVQAGNYAGAVGTAVRTAGQGLGMYALEAVDKTVSPWLDAAGRGVGGLLGTDTAAGAVKAGPVSAPAPAPAAAPVAATSAAPQPVLPPSGAVAPTALQPQVDAAPIAGGADLPNNVTRVGNSYSGANIGQGFTINGAQASMGASVPNAQNMAAAQALADRQVAPGAGLSVIGDDSGRARDRQALMGAASTAYRGAQNGQLTANQLNVQRGMLSDEMRDATSRYQGDQSTATNRDIAAMREAGDMGRAAMREAGETGRAADRTSLDSRRVGMEERSIGFKVRDAERMEKLRDSYSAAKPEERKAIAQQIRELQGTAPADAWAHSPGGQMVDPKTQQLITQPGVIYNRQTGEAREGQQAAQQPLQNHIDALKKNPQLATQFDRQYGAGAAARLLGTR